MRRFVALLSFMSVVATIPLTAQRLEEFPPDAFPADLDPTAQPTTSADIDGDGLVDLLVGSRVLLNQGDGRFADAATPWFPAGLDLRWCRFFDVDLDGDLDAIAMPDGTNQVLTLFYNDGTRFVPAPPSAQTLGGRWGNALVFDADGSGALDVLVYDPVMALLLAPGDGTLHGVGSAGPRDADPAAVETIAWDFDHDGDLDVLETRDNGFTVYAPARLWENEGGGVFTEAPSRLPANPPILSHLLTIDLDGDGFDELVGVADLGISSSHTGELRVWSGNGTGGPIVDRSTTALPPGLPPSIGITRADVDLDGRPDVVSVSDDGTGRVELRNEGTGKLPELPCGVPDRPATDRGSLLGRSRRRRRPRSGDDFHAVVPLPLARHRVAARRTEPVRSARTERAARGAER